MKTRGPVQWSLILGGGVVAGLLFAGCQQHESVADHAPEAEASKLVVTRPLKRDTVVMRDFVCRIHSSQNIEVRALERGYLQSVEVSEGQFVHQGQRMFKILPLLHEAELKRAEAEAQAAAVEFDNTRQLAEKKVVSESELAITRARMEKAQAEVSLARAHLEFTDVRAPFDGLVDRLRVRTGSLIAEGDLLTTLSDNRTMWVYFNLPEADYLEYASQPQPDDRKVVDLIMANGNVFGHPGRISTIEAEFNAETGTIPFRADFLNPEGLLRHGATGSIRMKKLLPGAVLVPQKAVHDVLDHHYVMVVGTDGALTQQRIRVTDELEDFFVVGAGVTENDTIVIEGGRPPTGAARVEPEFVPPETAFQNLKLRAE
ncbi:MAG: efflux RND transporter periplasmic adaptor subunit [Verrucomicrobiae bacterium]|nr:efflux RND transporter periplasmic adaptor subunit [Verrucomicrobiae bacterium]